MLRITGKLLRKVSIDTSAIQYENDDLMRPDYGDDYGIACCVSPMKIGKQMQYFGARANLAKCLLYAINGGRDEKSGVQVAPRFEPITSEYLDYNEVMEKYEQMMRWLAKVYVNALKIIHYMHDKYAYEAFEMGLHDGDVERIRATGIAGLSIVADSLAAIRDTKVKVIRDERGLAVDFEREGEYVPFGNNDDRTDSIAVDITEEVHGISAPASDIPQGNSDTIYPDDHIKRGLRKENRNDSRRPSGRYAVRSGS